VIVPGNFSDFTASEVSPAEVMSLSSLEDPEVLSANSSKSVAAVVALGG